MLLLMVVFKFIPAFEVLWLSFTSWDMLSAPRFVGFDNYVSLIQDPLFQQSIQATMFFVFGAAIPIWIVALILGMIFTMEFPWKSAVRTLYFLPNILPAVVFAIVWRFLLQPYGLLNQGLSLFGIPSINWLNDVHAVIPAFILATDWATIPFFMIIYLTALQTIPRDYYEAAQIDGASALQRFWHITLPQLRPTMLLVVVISITFLSRVFTSVLILTNGGPDGASRVLPMFIYQMGFEYFKMGRATAASIIFLLGLMVFTVIQLRLFQDDGRAH
jgi:ABC-type sugar transport system permease subunit